MCEALDLPERWIGMIIAIEECHELLVVRQKYRAMYASGKAILAAHAKVVASAINTEVESLIMAFHIDGCCHVWLSVNK